MIVKNIFVFLFLSLLSMSLLADKKGHGKKVIEKRVIAGVAATGANILRDKTLWRFPDPWGEITVISSGAFNPDGEDALDLTSDMPGNTLVVNKVDPKVVGAPHQFPENLPLRDVPTYVDTDLERGNPPNVMDTPKDTLSRSNPDDPITIGEWEKAKGKAKIKCFDDGTAEVKVKMRGLIPNGLYTMWQTMGAEGGGLTAVPWGGAPNVVVPDQDGDARFVRELNGCPFIQEEGEKPVLLIEVAYHSDDLVYGGVPDSADIGLPFGLQTNTQLNFPINIIGNAQN